MLSLFRSPSHGTLLAAALKLRDSVQLWWTAQSLARKFTAAASTVVLFGMLIIGAWVADRIRTGVLDNNAAASARLIDSYLLGLLQSMASQERLPEDAIEQLDRAVEAIRNRVHSVKIWRPDGRIVYSDRHELIGKAFPITRNLRAALNGTIAAVLDGDPHEGDPGSTESGASVLEIYAPVQDLATRRIIGAAEFYSVQPTLYGELQNATVGSWLVVAAVTTAMISALYGIVRNGSRTIEMQRSDLKRQIRKLHLLLQQNQELQRTVERARRRSSEINERVLRRVGSELHDGPAQLISLALLLTDAPKPSKAAHALDRNGEPRQPSRSQERLQKALREALAEIRTISAGLVLPELDQLNLEQVIKLAASNHASRTATDVALELDFRSDWDVPALLKECAFRIVQEGLNNSFKHAGARGQRVHARTDGHSMVLGVSDLGPGLSNIDQQAQNGGLGLIGLRDRVETLGGTLSVTLAPQGSHLSVEFDLRSLRLLDAGNEW